MRFQFNAHNLIVYGMEDGEFLVSDPIADHLVRIAPADLENARFAKGTLAPRGFLYYPEDVPSSIALEEPIRKAIRKTAQMMLYAPVPLIGVKGIRTLAGRIERLRRHPDGRYVKFPGAYCPDAEKSGPAGAASVSCTPPFCRRPATRSRLPVLKEASERMTESGDLWRTPRSPAARACKSAGAIPSISPPSPTSRASAPTSSRCSDAPADGSGPPDAPSPLRAGRGSRGTTASGLQPVEPVSQRFSTPDRISRLPIAVSSTSRSSGCGCVLNSGPHGSSSRRSARSSAAPQAVRTARTPPDGQLDPHAVRLEFGAPVRAAGTDFRAAADHLPEDLRSVPTRLLATQPAPISSSWDCFRILR